MFIRKIVMNSCGPLKVKEFSYRTEFQMRGAPHIHGILWVDVPAIVKENIDKGDGSLKYLESGLEKLYSDQLPSTIEKESIAAFIDKFVSCSIMDPATSQTVRDVQIHHHTRSCHSRGNYCRFYFPMYPSLRTIISIPIRVLFPDNDEKKQQIHVKLTLVLGKVQNVLEDEEFMKKVNKLHGEEIEKSIIHQDYAMRSDRILEDPIFKGQLISQFSKCSKDNQTIAASPKDQADIEMLVSKILSEDPTITQSRKRSKAKPSIAASLMANLIDFQSHYESISQDHDLMHQWKRERLLAVLSQANIVNLLNIDQEKSIKEQEMDLLDQYHELLSYSTKGFSTVLKRDTSEIYVNKYNPEWLSVSFNLNHIILASIFIHSGLEC